MRLAGLGLDLTDMPCGLTSDVARPTEDAFTLVGHHSNRCCVVPPLNLVAVRIGSGPPRGMRGR